MRMRKKLLCAVLLGMLIPVACDEDDNNNVNQNNLDRDFMIQAGYANKAEIEAGQLAASKGEMDSVRMFGQMMVTDHQTAYNELKSIGDDIGITVPDSADQAHKAMKQYLMTLSGYAFDTAYINSQIKDHQQAMTLFQNMANSGQNQRIKDYANKYLPAIQLHLQKAINLRNQLTMQQGTVKPNQ